jgi:hypothetical protein
MIESQNRVVTLVIQREDSKRKPSSKQEANVCVSGQTSLQVVAKMAPVGKNKKTFAQAQSPHV